jgi:hypothetical protein
VMKKSKRRKRRWPSSLSPSWCASCHIHKCWPKYGNRHKQF